MVRSCPNESSHVADTDVVNAAHTYGYARINTITHIVTLTNPKLETRYRNKSNANESNEVLAFHGSIRAFFRFIRP